MARCEFCKCEESPLYLNDLTVNRDNERFVHPTKRACIAALGEKVAALEKAALDKWATDDTWGMAIGRLESRLAALEAEREEGE